MRNISIGLFIPLILMLGRMPLFAQEPVPLSKNYVAWAQDFLRTMYPDLNGKGYFLSLESAGQYDNPGTPLPPTILYVGHGPEYEVLGMIGGCLDFGPVPPPGAHVASPPPSTEDCQIGPRHPKQELETGFRFDNHDRLVSFGAHGPAVGNPEALNKVTAQMRTHPEMTDSEIIAALKKAGAKYGPNDKELLLKNFPYTKLGRFLGNIRILSVDYTQPFPMSREIGPENPWWEVTAAATQRDGTVITYKFRFEEFKGNLLGCVADGDR